MIAWMAIPIVALVIACTWYFTSRQLAQRGEYEDSNLDLYGDQYALELRSAVAFGDRATASEVLGPIASDPDVASATLFDGRGTVLYQWGAPSPWIGRAKRGVIAKRIVHQDGRSAVVAPVVSLEGPRGTLVIELGTETRFVQYRRLIGTSVLAALIALAVGVLAAWLVARSLTRRLAAIGRVALAATTDHDIVVDDEGNDEIGVLAIAFNEMLAQLRGDRVQLTAHVRQLRAAEDELAAANRELEQRVADRTAALEAEMKRRADVELELRQAQKLESVGRLAAGIAHEINSPVQFVSHSCSFLDEATESLIELLALRRDAVAAAERGELTLPQLAERLRDAEREIGVDELVAEVPAAGKRVAEGLQRVTSIVRAMKEFAFADHPTQRPNDLNRAVQNTLLVTGNEYTYVADTQVMFGTLPPVTCHLGELNQAILNIIVNAAHAIGDANRGSDRRGCISVKTWVDGPNAVVSIADDGCGIPPEIVDKIFDPFFTTKAIGRGSGQGLAIARAVIVDKHRGRIDVTSKVGVGTTFTIRVPIAGARWTAIAV